MLVYVELFIPYRRFLVLNFDIDYASHKYTLVQKSKMLRNKRSERCKHCALAVVRRSQNFSSRRRPPSRGRRTAKI